MYFRPPALRQLAEVVSAGQVGLFPFDTIWGLLGGMTVASVRRIRAMKQRSPQKAMIVMVPDMASARHYAVFREADVKAYWPGPNTLILPKRAAVPDWVTGGRQTVGVRVPSFLPLRLFLEILGQPIVTSSANLSGEDWPRRLDDIPKALRSQVDFVYDDFVPETGQPSAIWDMGEYPATRIR